MASRLQAHDNMMSFGSITQGPWGNIVSFYIGGTRLLTASLPHTWQRRGFCSLKAGENPRTARVLYKEVDIDNTSSLSLAHLGLQKKNPMGMPPTGGTFNGIHMKGADVTAHFANMAMPTQAPSPPLRPDATRATPPSSLPGTTANPSGPFPTITATPLAAITPPSYLPNMSTAIVPHPGALSSAQNTNSGGTELVKKKRGRPRKYGTDGTVAIMIKPFSSTSLNPLSPLQKRGRGRPPGTGKHQQLAALGELMCASAGAGFTPHAVTVAAGEDVAAKIMSFSQQGPRGICILSANGAISNVTLRQPSTSGGTVTYEGRFEILSLSGSFLVMDADGTRSRTGGLSVSLAGPDGRVLGGGVAGMLIAASPVQVVVGSFMCSSKKAYSKLLKNEGGSKPTMSAAAAANVDANAPPELSMNDMGENKQDSPQLNQSSANAASSNDVDSPPPQMIAVQMGWSAGSHGAPPEGKRNADIDISSSGR